MNTIIIDSSKNPLMWMGMFITSIDLSTVSTSSTTNIIIAMKMNAHGFWYALLSLTRVRNSTMNIHIATATNARLYSGATCASASPSDISHTPL